MEVESCIFAKSLTGATIQDGGTRERSDLYRSYTISVRIEDDGFYLITYCFSLDLLVSNPNSYSK